MGLRRDVRLSHLWGLLNRDCLIPPSDFQGSACLCDADGADLGPYLDLFCYESCRVLDFRTQK